MEMLDHEATIHREGLLGTFVSGESKFDAVATSVRATDTATITTALPTCHTKSINVLE